MATSAHPAPCAKIKKQSCEGLGTRHFLFAAYGLFLAARYQENGKRPRQHMVRPGPSPAQGLLVLLGTHECSRRPSWDLGAGIAGGGWWPCWSAAGASQTQFIGRADRAGPLRFQGLSDLGKPLLPPASHLLAVVFPPNPFTQHPHNIIGHYNPWSLTFQQVRANQTVPHFTPNRYDVLATSYYLHVTFLGEKMK